MGHVVKAKCLDCGKAFTVEHGGGFSFHLVRCDKCGKTKSIGFDDLGELHLRYLKGLSGSNSLECNHLSLESISEEEYWQRINVIAGECRCRGKYTLDALPRCPKCLSTQIEEGETTVMYD
jgi:hypothetical protein